MKLFPTALVFFGLMTTQALAYGGAPQAMQTPKETPKMEAMEKAPEGRPLQLMQKAGLGSYLADSKGMTLYYFAKEAPGKFVCKGDCLKKWPPLAAGVMTKAAGTEAKDFGTIVRDDGFKQATFRGFPVYYFAGDVQKGDTNGQGFNEVWFVIDPAQFPPKG